MTFGNAEKCWCSSSAKIGHFSFQHHCWIVSKAKATERAESCFFAINSSMRLKCVVCVLHSILLYDSSSWYPVYPKKGTAQNNLKCIVFCTLFESLTRLLRITAQNEWLVSIKWGEKSHNIFFVFCCFSLISPRPNICSLDVCTVHGTFGVLKPNRVLCMANDNKSVTHSPYQRIFGTNNTDIVCLIEI